jgi:hypothetical protein
MKPNLDKQMIERALRSTSFDLKPSDFTYYKYQEEIRYLFTLGYFPKFDSKYFVPRINQRDLNQAIAALKRESAQKFSDMYKYKLSGIGPGEVLLFFLVDDSKLGGGNAASVDLFTKGGNYEIKSAKLSNDGQAYDFRLSGTISLVKIISDLDKIRVRLKLSGGNNSMSAQLIDDMRKKASYDFLQVEKEYAEMVANSFKEKVIFMNNSTSPSKMGNVEGIQKVKPEDVTIERVTGGTVKPRIKLHR